MRLFSRLCAERAACFPSTDRSPITQTIDGKVVADELNVGLGVIEPRVAGADAELLFRRGDGEVAQEYVFTVGQRGFSILSNDDETQSPTS